MIDQRADLPTLMANLKEDQTLDLVRRLLDEGGDPIRIVEECRTGMLRVGELYKSGSYYISGLIMAGEIMNQVGKLIYPALKRQVRGRESGSILLGTVQGDIHFIGKNIFKVLLRCYGFDVHDVGEDVPPEVFLEGIVDRRPHIVGISCLISSAFEELKATMDFLRPEIRKLDRVPSLIIGGMVDAKVGRYVEADFWTDDALSGVRFCQGVMQGVNPQST